MAVDRYIYSLNGLLWVIQEAAGAAEQAQQSMEHQLDKLTPHMQQPQATDAGTQHIVVTPAALGALSAAYQVRGAVYFVQLVAPYYDCFANRHSAACNVRRPSIVLL